MSHDIFLRAHTVATNDDESTGVPKQRGSGPKWPDRVLVFDTETTIDKRQELTFGLFRVCRLVRGTYRCLREGVFHSDVLTKQDRSLLKSYVKNTTPEIRIRTYPPRLDLELYSRTEFVKKIFWPEIKRGAMVVGFNLPFDLSRIAVDWRASRTGGWSFVLSVRKSRKTGEIEPDTCRPTIRVTSMDSKSAFISLTKPEHPNEWPAARFLDLRTLGWALHNNSYSLDGACAAFSLRGKMNHVPTGKFSTREFQYCRQDVRATTELLNAMKEEFDRHAIRLRPDRAYSPASMAKAYLDAMGILPPNEKFTLRSEALGIAMQAYYGGRAECRIRKLPVPVVHTDFMSQYPTVNALLGNWNIVIANRVTLKNATADVKKLLKKVTLEHAFDPRFWRNLNFFALARPQGDVLPVRAMYNGQTQNIGINKLTSEQPIWFAGPDLVASVLYTGKVPQIIKAVRIVPHGVQKRLKRVSLRGMVTVNPAKDDFFRHVPEQRKRHRSDKALAHFLKVLANSGSYGLFVEVNPEQQHKPVPVSIFSGEVSFQQKTSNLEIPGRWYFPPIAALITAGARLLLAILERCVTDLGGSYLFCDTDSLCIVASKRGGLVPCPGGLHTMADGRQAIKALSWKQVKSVVARFERLNPYNRRIVPGSILKIERVNFGAANRQRQLYGYAISAKRYVLYEITNGDISIVDPKAHGLGYLYPAKERDGNEPDWISEAWEWLLRNELGLPAMRPAWLELPAMMPFVVSTHHGLARLGECDWARPFNFMLCPLLDKVGGIPAGVDQKRFNLIAPFTSDRARLWTLECVNVHDDVHDRKHYRLSWQQGPKLDKVVPQTFGYILQLYVRHPESKSLAPDGGPCQAHTSGLLGRTSVVADLHRYMGKETDRRWQQGEDLSLMAFSSAEYAENGNMALASDKQRAEVKNVGIREMMRRTGLHQHTIEAIVCGRPVRNRSLARALAAINVK